MFTIHLIKALEHAVGREAIVVGKPLKAFFNQALQIIGMNAEKTIMIGDDIVGDVKGANGSHKGYSSANR